MALGSPRMLAPSRRLQAARAHRRLRVAMASLSLTLLPAVWLASALSPPGPAGPVAVLLSWLLAWTALAVMLVRFRCPTCEGLVHWGAILDVFTTRCVNCGVSLDPKER